jgi:hypothetical protein
MAMMPMAAAERADGHSPNRYRQGRRSDRQERNDGGRRTCSEQNDGAVEREERDGAHQKALMSD